jgi:hypothetical protein
MNQHVLPCLAARDFIRGTTARHCPQATTRWRCDRPFVVSGDDLERCRFQSSRGHYVDFLAAAWFRYFCRRHHTVDHPELHRVVEATAHRAICSQAWPDGSSQMDVIWSSKSVSAVTIASQLSVDICCSARASNAWRASTLGGDRQN